jgi:hypothetical protein
MSEEVFWAALDAAVPRWRDRREYPLIFAGFERSSPGTQRERVKGVVTLALGTTFQPDSALEDALDLRLHRAGAHAAIERGLRSTPAYNAEWVNASKARRVADAFVGCFSADAEFLTNGYLWLPNEDTSAWTGLTSATFDTGVVAVDDLAAGILWVTDED